MVSHKSISSSTINILIVTSKFFLSLDNAIVSYKSKFSVKIFYFLTRILYLANINLIGVACSANESDEEYILAKEILKEKGVNYTNIIPDMESDFYKEFIKNITGFPTPYIIDTDGNIIGAPLIGVVSNQEDTLMKRILTNFIMCQSKYSQSVILVN